MTTSPGVLDVTDAELATALFGPAPEPGARGTLFRKPRPASRLRRGALGFLKLAAALVASAALSWALNAHVVKSFLIPSASMAATLEVGDRVFVSHLAPRFLDLHRGDVIVFTDPAGWLTKPGTPPVPPTDLSPVAQALVKAGVVDPPRDDYLIKRVIAVAGDRVTADGSGPVLVNGEALDEPYLIDGAAGSDIRFDVTVPERSVWVMGDNRPRSADSRYNQDDLNGGAVPLEDVWGVALLRMTPELSFERLPTSHAAFSTVPTAA